MIEALSRFSLSTSPSKGNNIKRLAPLLFGMSGVSTLLVAMPEPRQHAARASAKWRGERKSRSGLALGASRWRIGVRQLLIEGFVLALAETESLG